jgi:monovalent cation:H+ antiporter-2, CPA2 family
MGLLVNPRDLFSNGTILAVMIGLIVFGKFLVWTSVVLIFRYSPWTAITVGVGLTQIGEFSFVLVQVARSAGIIGNELYNATLAASLITILLNAALVRHLPAALNRIRIAGKMSSAAQKTEESEVFQGHVVICGFGRVGSAIGYALETFGIRYRAVEIDPDVFETLQTHEASSIFGDSSHSHLLERAGIRNASLLIVTVPDRDRARLTIINARKANSELPIMARSRRQEDYQFLMEAGATEVVQPELEAAATFIRHACGHYLMLPDMQIREYLRNFRAVMDSANRTTESIL